MATIVTLAPKVNSTYDFLKFETKQIAFRAISACALVAISTVGVHFLVSYAVFGALPSISCAIASLPSAIVFAKFSFLASIQYIFERAISAFIGKVKKTDSASQVFLKRFLPIFISIVGSTICMNVLEKGTSALSLSKILFGEDDDFAESDTIDDGMDTDYTPWSLEAGLMVKYGVEVLVCIGNPSAFLVKKLAKAAFSGICFAAQKGYTAASSAYASLNSKVSTSA